ncbi:uncharacterized protein LOC144913947 [Branchiostoma floridae x Branchiostoma belcheri]
MPAKSAAVKMSKNRESWKSRQRKKSLEKKAEKAAEKAARAEHQAAEAEARAEHQAAEAALMHAVSCMLTAWPNARIGTRVSAAMYPHTPVKVSHALITPGTDTAYSDTPRRVELF